MIRTIPFLLLVLLVTNIHSGWNPFKKKYKRSGEENSLLLINELRDSSESIRELIDNSVAWAVFPRVAKVAAGVGGARGNGKVFYNSQLIGTAKLRQLSVGFQLGGQVYGQVILFQDVTTFERFLLGEYRFGGAVSVAVMDEGWGEDVGFKDGTAVLIKGQKGLMYEAALKGQEYRYKPLKKK